METFKLHSYDGPATVGGVGIPRARFWEGAEYGTEGVIRWWEGRVKCSRSDAPDLTPAWAAATADSIVEVVLPAVGQGSAYATAVTLTDGYRWEVELRGTGPSPMA
ncbi:hypothetical protein [Streptomyces sp. NPDC048551]|uniref:hypothetical protein n=1 Tax=Streptomyces sp. NPDC048551 TaxID=3155758 RepID=UPI00344406CB